MRLLICLLRRHIPGEPVRLRGHEVRVCTRCQRPLEQSHPRLTLARKLFG